MQHTTARQDHTTPRPVHQERKAKLALPTPKQCAVARKSVQLAKHLIAGAREADTGRGWTNVTDMSSTDFIAFLHGR
ncbi:hypothetical protein [Methylobacterium sp. CM6246]